MSFRKNSKKLKVVKLPDNQDGASVVPKKGTNTLYWWNKGSDQDGWFVKADLYDIEGENVECLVAESFATLMRQIKSDYGLDA